jgi:glycosyltransferase involved in cell wall biosynthesis
MKSHGKRWTKKREVQNNMISMWPDSAESVSVMDSPPQDCRPAIRVCMLAYAFYESDTRILQYATALAQRGDTVDVIALRRDDSLPEFEALNGVNVYRIQSRTVNERGLFSYGNRILRFLFRSMWFLHRKHAEYPYNAVHVHNVPDFLVFATLAPKMRGARIILDVHDLLPEFYAAKFKIRNDSILFKFMAFAERCSAAFADHVIVANDLWRDRLVARSSRPAKCSVVRNRPDLDIFTKQTGRERNVDDPFLLIYPGSLSWHQGLDLAIRAFASIQVQMPDAEFHIYGEGPAKPSLMALVCDLKQQGRIFFHGFLPSVEIAHVMAFADLAIEPKRKKSAFGNEALSTKIMEFMALGVPVIACRTQIHAYYYDDSIIQYYEDDDENELAKQIIRLRNDPALRAWLVSNAKMYVEENTWNARKHEYLELVDSLVCKRTYASVVA